MLYLSAAHESSHPLLHELGRLVGELFTSMPTTKLIATMLAAELLASRGLDPSALCDCLLCFVSLALTSRFAEVGSNELCDILARAPKH